MTCGCCLCMVCGEGGETTLEVTLLKRNGLFPAMAHSFVVGKMRFPPPPFPGARHLHSCKTKGLDPAVCFGGERIYAPALELPRPPPPTAPPNATRSTTWGGCFGLQCEGERSQRNCVVWHELPFPLS